MRILIVEDEEELGANTQRLLFRNNYVADLATSVGMATSALQNSPYDLVILDRMLPDGDGLEVVHFCQEKGIETRYLILSAVDQIEEKVKGLESGADDYVLKPVVKEELLARVRASLRRTINTSKTVIRFGDLAYEQSTMNFLFNDESVVLRRSEGLIMEALMRKPGRVVTRNTLETALYGYDQYVESNSLEAQISRLRKSLANLGSRVTIKTVRGVGYVLAVDE